VRAIGSRNLPFTMRERLHEFYRRLREQLPSKTADEALAQIGETMDAVENEMSGIAKHSIGPEPNLFDGRMYPPHPKFIKRKTDGSIIANLASHRIEIGANGSIKILRVDRKGSPPAPPQVELEIPGGGTNGEKPSKPV
jgi:hypothetical protein